MDVETPFPPAMIATLGLQPQVITRALDRLLNEFEPNLKSVHIVHTGTFPRNHPHWDSLSAFKQYLAQKYPKISFSYVPIEAEDGRIVYDVETPDKAELTFKIIFNAVRTIKQSGQRLHGLIAGGRKSMIVYMMISAQLLFDEDDQLWHLFSTMETQDPHVPQGVRDKSHLIEIPILHLAGLMPMVRELILNSSDPNRATKLYRKHESVEQIVRLQRFHQLECDETDQKILRFAFRGWGNRQIGEKIGLTDSRISTRIGVIAKKFYKPGYGGPLRPWPKHVKIKLLDDLGPLLKQLYPED